MGQRDVKKQTVNPLSFAGTLLLAIIPAILVYFRITGYGFVLLDDGVNIYENPYLGPPLIENTLVFWKAAYEHLYIPFTYTVWQAVAAVSQGLKPGFFHFANLVVHLLNTLLLFGLLNIVVRDSLLSRSESGFKGPDTLNVRMGAFAGALLFSLHPMQVESVCWITELKGLLSALLSLLSIHFYLFFNSGSKKSGRYVSYLAYIFTFALALLSKPTAIMLPFIVFIFVSFRKGRERRPVFTPLIPCVAILIPFAIVTKMVQPDVAMEYVTPWYLRPLVAVDALSFYTLKLFFPINLSVDYGRSPLLLLLHPRAWLLWIFPSALFLLLFIFGKKTPFFRYLLISVLALMPVLGLVPFLFQKISTVSDHYFYMAMTGPALVFARLTALNWNRPAWRVAAVSIVTILAFQSFRQVSNWRGSLSLFKHTIKVNPSSVLGHTNIGKYYFLNGNFGKARFHYQKMVSLYPDDPVHLGNLASSYFALGRVSESVKTFEKALVKNPDLTVVHKNLSNIFEKLGKYSKALDHAVKSLKEKPDDPEVIARIARLNLLVNRE